MWFEILLTYTTHARNLILRVSANFWRRRDFCSQVIEHLRWFIIFLHIFTFPFLLCVLRYLPTVHSLSSLTWGFMLCSNALSSGWCFHTCSTLCLVEGICYSTSYGITSYSIKLPIDGRRWHDLASTRCLYIA